MVQRPLSVLQWKVGLFACDVCHNQCGSGGVVNQATHQQWGHVKQAMHRALFIVHYVPAVETVHDVGKQNKARGVLIK
jgi:hypothetical protein